MLRKDTFVLISPPLLTRNAFGTDRRSTAAPLMSPGFGSPVVPRSAPVEPGPQFGDVTADTLRALPLQ